MKEATGEANMTVITIVIIALVLAIGTPIVTSVLSNSGRSAACTSAGGVNQGSTCYKATSCSTGNNGKTSCSGATYTCSQTNGQWSCR